ncbi:MAG TPA: GNAT family protein [Puia sp.]|nr:GNAT family protein [Puia sp.]
MEKSVTLQGKWIRLEPMDFSHSDGLAAAAALDRDLYKWSPVLQGKDQAHKYIQTAIEWREAGKADPFVIVREHDGLVIGSTRLWNLEKWAWSPDSPRFGWKFPDTCEIGYSWLSSTAVRTAANTEAKLLLLTKAFEKWESFSVYLCADARNTRSREAIERIGAKFEGILRAHRLAVDGIPRNTARYSILAEEWPAVKMHLEQMLERR